MVFLKTTSDDTPRMTTLENSVYLAVVAQIITAASTLSFTAFSPMIFRFRISTFTFYTIANSASQLKIAILTTVEPPRKGHFGTNINSSGLSPL